MNSEYYNEIYISISEWNGDYYSEKYKVSYPDLNFHDIKDRKVFINALWKALELVEDKITGNLLTYAQKCHLFAKVKIEKEKLGKSMDDLCQIQDLIDTMDVDTVWEEHEKQHLVECGDTPHEKLVRIACTMCGYFEKRFHERQEIPLLWVCEECKHFKYERDHMLNQNNADNMIKGEKLTPNDDPQFHVYKFSPYKGCDPSDEGYNDPKAAWKWRKDEKKKKKD